MKKIILAALCIVFVSSLLTSCRQQAHCQAYSKANVVKADPSVKAL